MQLVARLHANSCMLACKLVHVILVVGFFDVTFLSELRVGMWSVELKEEYYTRVGSNRWERGISFGAE